MGPLPALCSCLKSQGPVGLAAPVWWRTFVVRVTHSCIGPDILL